MSSILVVVAHPDDEIFMGASIARFADEGHAVSVLSFTDGVSARLGARLSDVDARLHNHRASADVLGFRVVPLSLRIDQMLDATGLIDLTRRIEHVIGQTHPSIVYTHSLGDLNSDHRRVREAVLPAVRPKSGVREVYAFDGPRMLRSFMPTSFVEIKHDHRLRQLSALECYGDELAGERLHICGRQDEWGYVAGVPFAEGFETIRRLA